MRYFRPQTCATIVQRLLALVTVLSIAPIAQAQNNNAPALPPGTLIDTDFGQAGLAPQEQKSERVSGTLPAPWQDNSEWAKVWVSYQPLTEGGKQFQRVTISQLQDGRAQVTHPLPDVAGDKFYTLELTVRGTPELDFDMGVRQRGAPYEYFWETSTTLSAQWRDLSYQFQLSKNDQPIGLWLQTASPGHFDLARIRLVEMTRDDLLKQIAAQYPTGEPRNLLRLTRFPLGLPSGWWMSSETPVTAEAETVGPTRFPALHIQAGQPFQLYSAPFSVPFAGEEHVASFYIKGHGTGRCVVWADGRELASKDLALTAGTDWQRVEIPFTPVLLTKAYALRFEGTGEFWLDALQIEAGAIAKPYAPQLQCEVALASTSSVNIQFEDAPTVQYVVTGADAQAAPDGAVLRATVSNLYGETVSRPAIKLRTYRIHSGQLTYAAFPQHPLGAFRIEAWVEDTRGQRISPYDEIVINRLHRPHYWMQDAPNSPFGTHMLSTSRNILLAKAIGVNWTRLHDAGLEYIGWKYLEPEKGKWSFRDAEINRYRQYGMKILGELSTAPYWASYFQKPHDSYYDQFFQPKNLDDYANYVRVVIGHYKGVIDSYEVWNEPWNHEWWGVAYDATNTSISHGYRTSANPQADFAHLMQTAYTNAKGVDPTLTIAGFNTTTSPPGTGNHGGHDWTQGILDSGGLNACDIISYHQYMSSDAGSPGDEVETGFKTATGPIVDKIGKLPKPVWLSEGSSLYGMGRSAGFYNHVLTTPNADALTRAGDRLCRFEIALLGQGVRKTFLYSMASHGFFGEPNEWGIIVNPDGTLHPSGVALSALTWQLEDTTFARRIALTNGVYAYLFQGNRRAVAAIIPHEARDYKLPTNRRLTLTDLWGNPLAGGTTLGTTVVYAATPGTVDTLEKALPHQLVSEPSGR